MLMAITNAIQHCIEYGCGRDEFDNFKVFADWSDDVENAIEVLIFEDGEYKLGWLEKIVE